MTLFISVRKVYVFGRVCLSICLSAVPWITEKIMKGFESNCYGVSRDNRLDFEGDADPGFGSEPDHTDLHETWPVKYA